MKREFELKAAPPGGAAGFRERLADAGWRLSFEGLMSDRRFDTPGRSLESRDEVLRIRCMTPVRPAPCSDGRGLRLRSTGTR